jgi:hypothetical protein
MICCFERIQFFPGGGNLIALGFKGCLGLYHTRLLTAALVKDAVHLSVDCGQIEEAGVVGGAHGVHVEHIIQRDQRASLLARGSLGIAVVLVE